MTWPLSMSPSELTARLGWAVVHSLWLSLLVALATAYAMSLLAKRSPHVRYALACMALLGMILGSMSALWWGNPTESARGEAPSTTSSKKANGVGTSGIGTPMRPASLEEKPYSSWTVAISDVLKPAIPLVTTAWAGGMLLMAIRQSLRWRVTRRIRRQATPIRDSWLVESAGRLAVFLGIRRAVGILSSVALRVPAVLGWLRPVILLPLNFGTGLTTVQIEAILAHELAHIRRKDYLVNILQTVAEIVLFYHPAVWYVSRRIRGEREACCDEAAVSVCRDPLEYAEALISIARAGGVRMSLAADGGELLPRIRHILRVSGPVPARAAMTPFVLTLALAICVAAVALEPSAEAMTNLASAMASRGRATIVQPGSALEAVVGLERQLRFSVPDGWGVGSIRTGPNPVWEWNPPEGECYLLTLYADHRSVPRGMPAQVFLWLMDESYVGQPAASPRMSPPGLSQAPVEIAKWRGQRVLISEWADQLGWPECRSVILQALRDTDYVTNAGSQ